MREVDQEIERLEAKIKDLSLRVDEKGARCWRLKRGQLAKLQYSRFEVYKDVDPRIAVKALWASIELAHKPAVDIFQQVSEGILSRAFEELDFDSSESGEDLFLRGLQVLMALGLSTDAGRGIAYIRASAEKDYASAKHLLAVMYLYGKGLKEDLTKAQPLIENLAKQGHALAQNTLALMHEHGQGVGKNLLEAHRWYRLAADQGCPQAQYNLALTYDNGVGLVQNFVEAARWYRFAAEQGYADAQYNLGVMYENAEGLKRDPAEASRWYYLAAKQGHVEATKGLAKIDNNSFMRLFKTPSSKDEKSGRSPGPSL